MQYDSPGEPGILDDETPPFVISPSQIGAALKTAASLITFGVMFTTTIVGFARDLDLQGALIFLQRDDVTAWIAAVLTGLYLIWRSRRAWVKKFREILLVEHVPNDLAVLSSDLRNPDVSFRSAIANWLDPQRDFDAGDLPPPSRARETTTGSVRLVGAEALHGRQPAAPLPVSPPPPANRDGYVSARISALAPGVEIAMSPAVDEPQPVEIPVIDLRQPAVGDRIREGKAQPTLEQTVEQSLREREQAAPPIDASRIAHEPEIASIDRADTPVIP